MKAIPISAKSIFALITVLLLTIGFTGLLVHFNFTIKDNPGEETVQTKYSKKGLYLFPRFEIEVTNSERPSMVSKEQFESLENGDTVSGYWKNPDEFITEDGIRFEQSLGYVIIVFLYLGLFLYVMGLLLNVPFIKRMKVVPKIMKIDLSAIAIIYVAAGMFFTVATATNIFHKLNTDNQIETEAMVMGGEFNTIRSNRGSSYTNYELFIEYQDVQGDEHITKKAVTEVTYKQYDAGEAIPLTYWNNNVYDTFIQTKENKANIPAFFNLYTFFLAGFLVSLFFIIKAYYKKIKKHVTKSESPNESNERSVEN